MGLFDRFPWVNTHELNLDWIIQKMKEWGKESSENVTAARTAAENAAANAASAVAPYADRAEAAAYESGIARDAAVTAMNRSETAATNAENFANSASNSAQNAENSASSAAADAQNCLDASEWVEQQRTKSMLKYEESAEYPGHFFINLSADNVAWFNPPMIYNQRLYIDNKVGSYYTELYRFKIENWISKYNSGEVLKTNENLYYISLPEFINSTRVKFIKADFNIELGEAHTSNINDCKLFTSGGAILGWDSFVAQFGIDTSKTPWRVVCNYGAGQQFADILATGDFNVYCDIYFAEYGLG